MRLPRRLEWWVLGALLALGLAARIVFSARPAILWWDETIYLGMAKYLFSGGALGYWEFFRPVVFPFVLGSGWAIGLPIVVWGRALGVITGMGVVVLALVLARRLARGAELVTVALLVGLPTFFFFGSKLLSGVLATAFALLAVLFFVRERWYWAGFFAGLSFLTRFTQGLVLVGLLGALALPFVVQRSAWRQWSLWLRRGMMVVVGFFTLTIPFLIANLIAYGHAFSPLIEASHVFRQYNNWLYDLGNWYYVQQVLGQNVFFVLALVGIVALVVKKQWRDPAACAVVFVPVLLLAYFLWVPHKEIRFLVPVFPFLALLAAMGFSWLVDILPQKRKELVRVASLLVVVVLSLVINYLVVSTMEPEGALVGDRAAFFHFFDEDTDGLLLATHPLFMAYTDKPIEFLGSWEKAYRVFAMHGNVTTHVAVDLCDHPCEDGSDCVELREGFVLLMDGQFSRVFDSQYVRWDDVVCPLIIWGEVDLRS